MRYEEVLNKIVEGRDLNENSADILMMIHLTEPVLERRRWRLQALEHSLEIQRVSYETPRTQAARIAGTLLCLLFAPVKHRSFMDDMANVRVRYNNIAQDISLQVAFRDGLADVSRRGGFRSYSEVERMLPDALYGALRGGLAV